MNTLKLMPNWSLLQSFAAVTEYGSLSAAARASNVSQPTLSRHVSELEKTVGQRLFIRATSGLLLTPEGEHLKKYASAMADAASHLTLAISDEPKSLTGTVRVTASQIMATYVLPEIITDLNRLEPSIDIELVASDRTENLLRREADIAIRMYRPTQDDVITKKVGEMTLGMFAAHSYIDAYGAPKSLSDIMDHKFIGYDRNPAIIDGFKHVGVELGRDFFSFRSDDQVVCWQMIVAGLGVGFNQLQIGNTEPRVALIETEVPINGLPIWLTAHAELKSSPRVRFVYEFLATALEEQAS